MIIRTTNDERIASALDLNLAGPCGIHLVILLTLKINVLGDPEVTANIYCKSHNLPNTEMQNYSTDLR